MGSGLGMGLSWELGVASCFFLLRATTSNLMPIQLRYSHNRSEGDARQNTYLWNHHDLAIVNSRECTNWEAVVHTNLEILIKCIFSWLEVTSSPGEHAISLRLIISQSSLLIILIEFVRHFYFFKIIKNISDIIIRVIEKIENWEII